MKMQEFVIGATREAMGEAFRYARAVPADKVEWKPMETGRSVLDLTRELAKCPDWAVPILNGELSSSEDPEMGAEEMASWGTVEECEAALGPKLDRYLEFVAAFPDGRLGETMDLPFGAGGAMRTFSMAELLDYPRWNASYHEGQIAYIQTLYGDAGMH